MFSRLRLLFISLWTALFRRKSVKFLIIADIPLNQDSSYWKPFIGKKVVFIKNSPEPGLVDIWIPDSPILNEGVREDRFLS